MPGIIKRPKVDAIKKKMMSGNLKYDSDLREEGVELFHTFYGVSKVQSDLQEVQSAIKKKMMSGNLKYDSDLREEGVELFHTFYGVSKVQSDLQEEKN